jgi:hypothetical protein
MTEGKTTEVKKYKTSKRTIWGVILMVAPVVLLFVAIPGYAISSFVFGSLMAGSGSDGLMIAAKIINVILALLGVVSVLGLFICIPIGIYLVASKGKSDGNSNVNADSVGTDTSVNADDTASDAGIETGNDNGGESGSDSSDSN